MGHFGKAAQLSTFAILGHGIAYLLAILLARHLGVDGFEAYAVASAAFILMVTYAPWGLEKYALKLLPALYERKEWNHARGYIRFGVRRILLTSVVIASALGLWLVFASESPEATKLALAVSCVSLPTGALAHFGVDVLSAKGRAVLALTIFRIAVPSAALLLVLAVVASPVELNGAMAIGCWGLAWMLALAAVAVGIHRSMPDEARNVESAEIRQTWLSEARPFRLYRVSQALIAQLAVIALDALQPSAAAVGAYAAAFATASLLVVLATATNRFYAQHLSVLLERRDYAGILDLRRERLYWLLPTVAVFLALVFVYGREILDLFRPEFAEEGFVALQFLAIASATSVLFGLAPTYMKYRKHNRATLTTVIGAAIAFAVLLLLFVPRFAATGAAFAYALSICGMYLIFASMAHRELVSLRDRTS